MNPEMEAERMTVGAAAPEGRERVLVEGIKRVRAELAQLMAAADSSAAVYRALGLADMHLHWARWHLGEVTELVPESDRPIPE